MSESQFNILSQSWHSLGITFYWSNFCIWQNPSQAILLNKILESCRLLNLRLLQETWPPNCCDWLNIIPNLLSESKKSTNAISQLLSVEASAKTDLVKIEMNEKVFHWMFEVDQIGHCSFEVTQMIQTQRTQSWCYLK